MVKMMSFPIGRHSEVHPLKSKSKIFLNLKITFVNLQNRDANELSCDRMLCGFYVNITTDIYSSYIHGWQ